MKTLKKHYEYLPYIYLPILVLALILLYFFPSQILLCFRVHWLVIIFLLIIIITPIGNIRLGEEKNINFWRWLLIILTAEMGISLIYWGFTFVVNNSLPIFVETDNNPFTNTIHTLIITWGFYPFAAFLLMGIIFAYFGFFKKKPATLSIALQPLLNNKSNDALSLSADFIVRNVTLFMLAFAVGIVSLQLIIILAALFHIHMNTGLTPNTIITATVILFLINHPTWNQAIRNLSVKKIPLTIIVIIYSVFIAILILALNIGLNFLAEGNSILTNPVFQFKNFDWFNLWMILSGIWWIGWIPIMGGLIAFLSKGYKIRTVALGGILIFLMINLFLMLLTQIKADYLQNFNALASFIGIFLLMPLFLRTKYTTYQMRAVVPDTQPQKARVLHFYTQSLIKNAAFILILYLPMGIYLLNITIFVLIFPLAIAIATAFLAFGIARNKI